MVNKFGVAGFSLRSLKYQNTMPENLSYEISYTLKFVSPNKICPRIHKKVIIPVDSFLLILSTKNQT